MTTRLQDWQEKSQGTEKLTLVLISQVNGWNEWNLRRKKMFSLFEFGLTVSAVPKCYFDIICTHVVYPLREKFFLFTHFSSNQDFLDVYNAEHPSQTRDTYKVPKYWKFPLILRSAVLFKFLEKYFFTEKCAIVWERSYLKIKFNRPIASSVML